MLKWLAEKNKEDTARAVAEAKRQAVIALKTRTIRDMGERWRGVVVRMPPKDLNIMIDNLNLKLPRCVCMWVGAWVGG